MFCIRANRDAIASTPEDENSSIPKFDPRTQEQKRDDAHQVQILESNLRVEAMIADLAENPTTIDFDFDFDFDAGYSYGHDQEWLLYSVFFFMQKYPEVRGVYFIDFCDELEANTGYEVDHKQLDNLLKHWVPCKQSTLDTSEKVVADITLVD